MNKDFEVTLLSKEEVGDKSKVLQKVGIGCGESYWTSTPSPFNNAGSARELVVSSSGELYYWSNVSDSYGVRPVLKSDNLEDLIRNLKITYENGVETVEYGQYLDWDEPITIKHNLFKTNKTYFNPEYNYKNFRMRKYEEYSYNEQKVVKTNIGYFPVKSVKFYVDRENNMLISKDVLFDAPINVDNSNYDGHFETSQLYKFLNNEFIEILCPSLYRENKVQDETLLQPIEDNVQDEILLKQLEDENKKLKDEISRKKALLKKLKEIIAQNETFKVQSANLDSDIEKEISKVKVLKRN